MSDYSLAEDTIISALFEPDVDINVDVKSGQRVHKLTVSNTTSVMALKVQICGVMGCGVAPEKLEVRLGDVTLEDLMPLHFYGVKNCTKLDALKPYVNVKKQNNKGAAIYWRLERKDAIKEVKVKLVAAKSSVPIRFALYYNYLYDQSITQAYKSNQSYFNEIRGIQEGGESEAGMRLYIINDHGDKFEELNDDETVENYKIKDGDNLYLLTYRWLHDEGDVTVLKSKTKTKLQGVEPDETCLGIKVKVQDQMGLLVSTLNVKPVVHNSYDISSYLDGGFISDEKKPFMVKEQKPLVVITEEEWLAEHFRRAEEMKAQQEQ